MPVSNSIVAGRALVIVSATTEGLDRALSKAQAQLSRFGASISKMGLMLHGLGDAIVAPLITAGVAFAEMGSNLFYMSQRTGIAVEALSTLAYAAEQSKLPVETLELGIRRMQKTIVAAAEGNKAAQQTLQRLGLTFEELAGLTPEQQLNKIADGMNKIHDPTVKAGISLELFGRYGGTKMLQMLNLGSAGIEAYRKHAEALGLTISTKDTVAAAMFARALNDLKVVIQNTFFRIGAAVAPMLLRWGQALTGGIVSVNRWVSAHKELFQTALKVGAALVIAGSALIGIGATFFLVSQALSPLLALMSVFSGGVALIGSSLGLLLNPLGIVLGGLVALGAHFLYATGAGSTMLGALAGYFRDLKDTAVEAFGGVRDALSAGDWALAAAIAWDGLKLAWAQGIKPLKQMWSDFTHFFATIWENTLNVVVRAFVLAVGGIKSVLLDAKSLIDKAAHGEQMFIEVQKIKGERNARLKAVEIKPGGDQDEAKRVHDNLVQFIEDEYQEKLRGLNQIDDATNQQMKDQDRAAQESLAARTAEQLRLLDQIHDAEIAKINAKSDEEEAAITKDLNAKKDALKELAEKAKDEKALSPFLNVPNLPPPPGAPNTEDLENLMKNAVQVSGTFSAKGAEGLGVNIEEPINETAVNTAAMVAGQNKIIGMLGGFNYGF